MIHKILRLWSRVETLLIGLLIVAALLIFLGGAAVRLLSPMNALDYAEELAVYCIIWATALSGGVLAAERRHINTDILVNLMPRRLRRAVEIGGFVALIGFCGAMGWFGWQAFEFALLLDERSASTLRVPQAYAVFLALPVAMVLIVARMLLLAVAGQVSVSDNSHRAEATE